MKTLKQLWCRWFGHRYFIERIWVKSHVVEYKCVRCGHSLEKLE